MFSHVFVGSNDLERSRRFYDAVLGALGAEPGVIDPRGRLLYAHAGGRFFVSRPIDGEPATPANGGTVGFHAGSPEQAKAWHDAGVANGGTTCEDPPGVRSASNLYLAYLRDPDGNKLCALYPMPK